MFDLSASNLLGHLPFQLDWLCRVYLRKKIEARGEVMFCGRGLMIMPYFIGNTAALYAWARSRWERYSFCETNDANPTLVPDSRAA
jgi:hypothetical protein